MRAPRSRLNPQPWPWLGRRVLLEHPDASRADELVAVLRRAGYAVAVCSGPLPSDPCPLAGEDRCMAAEGADVVVSGLGFQTVEAREALAALRRRLPQTPLLVEAGAEDVARWPKLVEGCQIIDTPAVAERILAGVQTALGQGVGDVA